VEKPFRIAQDSGINENPELCTEIPENRGLELIHHFRNVAFFLERPSRSWSRSQSHRLRDFAAESSQTRETMHCADVESQKERGKSSDAASVEMI
jgi:hypothetical protein